MSVITGISSHLSTSIPTAVARSTARRAGRLGADRGCRHVDIETRRSALSVALAAAAPWDTGRSDMSQDNKRRRNQDAKAPPNCLVHNGIPAPPGPADECFQRLACLARTCPMATQPSSRRRPAGRPRARGLRRHLQVLRARLPASHGEIRLPSRLPGEVLEAGRPRVRGRELPALGRDAAVRFLRKSSRNAGRLSPGWHRRPAITSP